MSTSIPAGASFTAACSMARLEDRLRKLPEMAMIFNLLPRQPSLLQQRFHLRIASAEGAIHRRRILGATSRKDHLAELVAVGAGHAAVLLEPVVGVVVEHFAPEVGVIAGRVAATPDMGKVC